MSAKIDLKFLACDCEHTSIKTFCNSSKEDVAIHTESDSQSITICLDIPTAIKFAKTLRTEINKAKEGGKNG